MEQGKDRHLGTGYLYSTGTGGGQAPGNWVSLLVLFSLSRKEGERRKHRQIKLNAETIKWMRDPVEGTIKEEANGNLGWGEHPLAAEKDRAGRGGRERERGEEEGREELCRRRTWRRRGAEWRRTREGGGGGRARPFALAGGSQRLASSAPWRLVPSLAFPFFPRTSMGLLRPHHAKERKDCPSVTNADWPRGTH